jgi:hypothetical protein
MKVQAPGVLILIACILTGCGKSMQDVAGVYESAEIKEPLNSASYYSTTWVLDLAESGTFTLEENKSRQHIQGHKFAPVPMNGSKVSGEWKLDLDSIVCNWSGLTVAEEQELAQLEEELEEEPTPPSPFNQSFIFDVQTSGDVIAVLPGSRIDKLRFKRVE